MSTAGNTFKDKILSFAAPFLQCLPQPRQSEEVLPHQPEVVLSVLHVQSGGIFRSAMTCGRSLCRLKRHNIPQDTISTSTCWCLPIRTGTQHTLLQSVRATPADPTASFANICLRFRSWVGETWDFIAIKKQSAVETPRRPNPPRDPDQAAKGAFDVETTLMARYGVPFGFCPQADESDEHFWVDVWLFLKQVLYFFFEIAIWWFTFSLYIVDTRTHTHKIVLS